jgi:hypothetical protein
MAHRLHSTLRDIFLPTPFAVAPYGGDGAPADETSACDGADGVPHAPCARDASEFLPFP